MPVTAGKFTAIVHTYFRPALLQQALDALIRQTYSNMEIIIIDDGATPETKDLLRKVESRDPRVRILPLAENQFSLEDPHKIIAVGFNAALNLATGDYIWYQADDDLIADDYAEKMVALFLGNRDCTTAAGISLSIDIHGNVLEDPGKRNSNFRSRYMAGHELALAVAHGQRGCFSAPGNIFTIRRDALIQAGGYHRCFELSQLYGVVPFGVTGFDESAFFFWRRHEGQLNKQLAAYGWLGIDEQFSLLRDWEIERRWRNQFGVDAAKAVVVAMNTQLCRSSATWCATNLVSLRPVAAWRIFHKIWRQPAFWRFLPRQFLARSVRRSLDVVREAIPAPLRRALKPLVRKVQRKI